LSRNKTQVLSELSHAGGALVLGRGEQREEHCALSTESVLDLLGKWLSEQFGLAEVVGRWGSITFPERRAETVRSEFSQFGVYRKNARKCWQRPCG
jgi:hypothetical protein